MLYLENNRATDVFTRERFETLELICLSAAGRFVILPMTGPGQAEQVAGRNRLTAA